MAPGRGPATHPLLLGIDVGTYSSKGVLVTVDGAVVAHEVVEHTMEVPRPGWAEQDADAVWWADCVALCRSLLPRAPSGAVVGAVAVSAIGPCLVPLDADDRPLRPAILYGVDSRATAEIDELNRAIGEAEIEAFSGMALTSQAVGPKIRWLRTHEPEVWARTRRLTTATSYLVHRLTGEHVMDRHTAGHYVPLFDPATAEWSERFAAHVAPIAMLPRLGWSDELAGHVTAHAAAATGLERGIPVAVGAVDALSEAISVGAVEPGDLMIMYGSTTFFIAVTRAPVRDRRTWSVPGAFAGQSNVAAGMATTGSLTRWIRDELARELPEATAYQTLFDAASRIGPGSGGLLVLPYFSGERTPINDPHARGVIAGLSLAHTRDHLFRAALEGVAYGIRDNLATFAAMGLPVERIIAVGGGARGTTWLQIVSDVTGFRQIVTEQTIGASYGDAFLAGRAAGLLKRSDLAAWVRTAAVIEPDGATRPTYDALFSDYKELYRSTADLVHRLSGATAAGRAGSPAGDALDGQRAR